MVTIGAINYTYRHNDIDYMDWLLLITVWRNNLFKKFIIKTRITLADFFYCYSHEKMQTKNILKQPLQWTVWNVLEYKCDPGAQNQS